MGNFEKFVLILYHLQKGIRLFPCDFSLIRDLSQRSLQKVAENPQHQSQILFTDKHIFTEVG